MSKFQQHASMRLRVGGDDSAAMQLRARSRLAEHAAPRGVQALQDGDGRAPTGETLQHAVREAIDYQRSERGVLKLRTQEGDVVRLRFMNRDSLSAEGRVHDDGERVFGEYSLSASSSSKFKIAVKGDLNAEERAAIEDVLAQAGELAERFFDGDTRDAFALAREFEIDSEQLARVNLRFSVHERMALAQQVMASQPAEVADAPAAAPATSAPQVVAGSPKDTTTAPVALTDTAVEAQPVSPQIQTAIAPPVAADVEAPAQPESPQAQLDGIAGALQTITSFLTRLTESLEAMTADLEAGKGKASLSFSYGFKLQVVAAFVEGARGDEDDDAPAAAVDLAAQTIDELAAQSDARLDDVA